MWHKLLGAKPVLIAFMSAAVLVLVVGFAATAPAYAQGWEVGDVCIQDYLSNANCTANDFQVISITPNITEACTFVGDSATARFTFQLQTTATTRYDIGMFVALDGASALTGNSCYHDVLQPAATTGWNFTSGLGPFRQEDPDLCADMKSSDNSPNGVFYLSQVPVTITCVDNNADGIVDPISVCTSYDNNAGNNCSTVSQAVPGTGSKCYCQTVAPTPPIVIYKGLDYGDLPDTYGTLFTSNGARHSVQKLTPSTDNTPSTIAGVPAVWLGNLIDFSNAPLGGETDGIPDTWALGDDGADFDDEDGVTPIYPWTPGSGGGKFNVVVSSSSAGACPSNNCKLGFWIDWNNDGDFNDSGESYLQNVGVGLNVVTFDVPSPDPTVFFVYARFRLYAANYVGSPSPTGLVGNGEVEDYRFDLTALSVTLADFYAEQVDDYVQVTWETVSELNNRGFNLYRATSAAGPYTRLNTALIPSQSQGSPSGFTYTWQDRDGLAAGVDYYYLLEDVDLSGAATSHGPVSVSYVGPTAVGLGAVQALPAAAAGLPLAGTLLALAAGLAGGLAMRRRA